MKFIILVILFSSNAYSFESSNDQKIKAMEQRILLLEKALKSKNASSGLVVKDLKNSTVDRAPSSANSPQLSDEQQKEIMKTLQKYKQNREEQMKMLDELDKDI